MPYDPRRVKRLKRCHLALILQKNIFKRKLILHSLVDAPPTNPKKGCVNGHILSIKKIYRLESTPYWREIAHSKGPLLRGGI